MMLRHRCLADPPLRSLCVCHALKLQCAFVSLDWRVFLRSNFFKRQGHERYAEPTRAIVRGWQDVCRR
jgi:hypothetical protein